MDTTPTLTLIVDAGERFFQRRRQRCALLLVVAPNGQVQKASYAKLPTHGPTPTIDITLEVFRSLARQHGLLTKSRSRYTPAERQQRKANSLKKYRDRKKRERKAARV